MDYIDADGISQKELKNYLGKIDCSCKVTILDCCHAQAMGTRSVPNAAEILKGYTGTGCVTFMASDSNEKSVELPDKGHGAFTYYLTQGLKGAADKEQTGVVTFGNLWEYLDEKVTNAAKQMGNTQTPRYKGDLSHKFPMSVNKQVLGHKTDIEDKIRQITGPYNEDLASDEARYCLEILHESAGTKEEKSISDIFDGLLSGYISVNVLKSLINHAIRSQSESIVKPDEVLTIDEKLNKPQQAVVSEKVTLKQNTDTVYINEVEQTSVQPTQQKQSESKSFYLSDMFTDDRLREAVKKALNGKEKANEEELSKIRTLYLLYSNINNLLGIEKLINLREISLEGCSNITDIKPLSGLIYLQNLELVGCHNLSDISIFLNFKNWSI